MKRIITCSDGTWNKPDTIDQGAGVMTNVEKIYKCIAQTDPNGIEQVKYYDEGVGTGPGEWKKISGGVTGDGVDKNIKDAYKFLIWNYTGFSDELYLFGFSRGAYTARSLAGFIRNCGILRPENLHLVDEAFELYRDRTILAHPDSDSMISFRKQYCHNGNEETNIKCIGVWDTVGALGIPLHFFQLYNQERYKFHDVTLSSWVENAFHALAIDERRKVFSPTLFEASKNIKPSSKLEQVWFSGVHANIGGGYKQSGLSDITLEWMMGKVEPLGLNFNKALLVDDSVERKRIHIKPKMKGYMRDSIKDFWVYWFESSAWRIIHFQREQEDPSRPIRNRTGHRIGSVLTNEMLHISAYNRFLAHIDKKVSPYLHDTISFFKDTNLIDYCGEHQIDNDEIESQESGDNLTKGAKQREP